MEQKQNKDETNTESKKPMTDEERLKLANKLDEELDEFISGLEKKPYTEGWPEDRWEEEMDKHPFFMKKPPEPGEELHPLLEGIQQLKYDPEENTAEDLANSYKEDGNFNFKHKNYRLAILSYTEGIRQKFDNPELRASLHNNRSASHYFLKNYRSSLRECETSLKHKPNYDKVIIRAANCCFEISLFDRCIEYCDKILFTDPENKDMLALRQKAINVKKNQERDIRKKEVAEKKKKKYEEMLIKEILSRGIKMDVLKDGLKIEHLEPKFPELAQSPVSLDENNSLIWPIMLMFPEYKLTEFIQQYSENDNIHGLLCILFEEPAQWDTERKYSPEKVNIYFENRIKKKLNKISTDMILKDILTHKEFILVGGIPTFIVLAKDSTAEKHFLSSYK